MSYATIRGTAYDTSRTPIPGLQIDLLVTGRRGRVRVVETVTCTPAGAFLFSSEISAGTRYRLRCHRDGVQFQVVTGESQFQGDNPPAHALLVVQALAKDRAPDTPPAIPAASTHSLRGYVRHADGFPVPAAPAGGEEIWVRLHKREVDGTLTQLASAEEQPDSNGRYAIAYAGPEPRLVAEVWDADSSTSLGVTKVPYPDDHQILDLYVDQDAVRRTSEFARIDTALAPSGGQIEGKDWDTVDDNGIEILAQENGFSEDAIRAFRDAHIAAAVLPTTSTEAIYGLIRGGQGSTATDISGLTASRIEAALQRASEQNLVGVDIGTGASTHSTTLKADQVAFTSAGSPSPLSGHLALAVTTSAKRTAFATALRDHVGSEADFWTDLDSNPVLTDSADRAELRKMYETREASADNPSVYAAVQNQFGAATYRDVAAFTTAQWQTVMGDSSAPTVPEEFEDQAAYIEHMRRVGERRHPNYVVRQRLIDNANTPAAVVTFLNSNPDHDFTEIVTDSMATGQLKTDLQKYRRLFLVGPEFDREAAIDAMIDQGLDSAWSITRSGRRALAGVEGVVGSEAADSVFAKAKRNYGFLANLLASVVGSGNNPAAVPDDNADDYSSEFATVASGLGFCQCKDCRSILSPAAYLVDLLHWLDQRPDTDTGADTLLDILDDRRPDIRKLILSCDNTNTPIPYVDLVLEVLENDISPRHVDDTAVDTTGVDAAELLANPHYVNEPAYSEVASAVFPMSAPWSLFNAQADAFLAHVSTSRLELMTEYQTDISGALEPTAVHLAGAHFGMSGNATDALKLSSGIPQAWGQTPSELTTLMAGTLNAIRQRLGTTKTETRQLMHVLYWNDGSFSLDPAAECDPDLCTLTGSPAEADFGRLNQFVRAWRATGWSWLTLDKATQALSWTDFDDTAIQEMAALQSIVDMAEADHLDVSSWWSLIDTRLDPWDSDTPELALYDRLFSQDAVAKLRDATGSLSDDPFAIDRATPELVSPGDPMESHLEALVAAFGTDEQQLLSAMADVGTSLTLTLGELSAVYRRVSVAKALGMTVDEFLGLRDLQWHKPVRLSGYIGNFNIAGIGGLSPVAGDVVVATDGGTPGGSSTLFATGDIAEFDGGDWQIRIANVGGFPPAGTRLLVSTGTVSSPLNASQDKGRMATFDGTSFLPALESPEDGEIVKVVGLGASNEGDVLEFSGTVPTGTWGAGTSVMDPFADPLQAREFVEFAHTVLDSNVSVADLLYISQRPLSESTAAPTDEYLQSVLGQLRDTAVAAQPTATLADATGRELERVMVEQLGLGSSTAAAILDHLSSSSPISDATPPTPPPLEPLEPYFLEADRSAFYAAEPQSPPERYESVLDTLRTNLNLEGVPPSQIDFVASEFGLDSLLLDALRSYTFGALAAPDWMAPLQVSGLTSGDAGDWADIDRATYPQAFVALELLHQLSILVQGLNLTTEETLAWLDDDLNPLVPMTPLDFLTAGWVGSAEAWRQLFALVRFRDGLPGASPTFAELWQAKNTMSVPDDFLVPLEERTGWPADEVLGLILNWEVQFLDGRLLDRIRRCAVVADRIGAGLTTTEGLRSADLDAADSTAIVEYVRGHYDRDDWLAVAADVRAPLREAQRSTLVDYVLAANGLTEPAELQAQLLCDVEMSPCMMTSRVKFALSAVQQFIQRGLLNLEAANHVGFAESDRREWEWMKSYRVWEAARKVFLYPENWIEPSLRDSKSDLFEEFESQLERQELTSRTAEVAAVDFFEGVFKLSGVKVVAVETSSDGTTHLVGREASAPHAYYYRTRTSGGTWTPWENLSADLQTDRVAIGLLDDRVLVFWASLTQDEGDLLLPAVSATIHWTERGPDGWIAHRNRSFEHIAEFPSADGILLEVTPVNSGFDIDLVWGLSYYAPDYIGDPFFWIPFPVTAPFWAKLRYSRLLDDVTALDRGPFVATQIMPSLPTETYFDQNHFRTRYDELVLANAGRTLAFGEVAVLQNAGAHTTMTVELSRAMFHDGPFIAQLPDGHSYVVTVEELNLYGFSQFDHPYAATMLDQARSGGAFAVLDPQTSSDLYRQQVQDTTRFQTDYDADTSGVVATPYPADAITFHATSAQGPYNWEAFFHVPFMAATRLTAERRYEDAHRWFSCVYDPFDTDTSITDPEVRAWKVKPLMEPPSAPVTAWAAFTGAAGDTAAAQAFSQQYDEWLLDPFNPHLLARLRPGTYQRAFVMRYLDNVLAWADDLFTRDSIESLNEATTLYLLALHILGPRPEELPPRTEVSPKHYDDLEADMGGLNNPILDLEDLVDGLSGSGATDDTGAPLPNLGVVHYFCIPANEKLLEYWDTIEDRLFKIRHCMDIEGRIRSLPLFQPPIDPALLVRASALGVDLGTVLDELLTPLPRHRFEVMVSRAKNLLATVKSLGSAMLQAIEKRDAESVSLLRSTLEIDLQRQVSQLRRQQVQHARQQLAATRRSIREADDRRAHYDGLIERDLLPAEVRHRDATNKAADKDKVSGQLSTSASTAHGTADVVAKTGSPFPDIVFGGSFIGRALEASATGVGIKAGTLRHRANMLSIRAGHVRRRQDWRHQRRQATLQLATLKRQEAVSEIAVALAEKELANHEKQVSNLTEIDRLMRSKYSNEELYEWHRKELSALYFQTFQMARDYARQAQRCYRHELADSSATFITAGHFDSRRDGLLAGERLQVQVDQMEAAYFENDVRECELTKHVSLKRIDPMALLRLVEDGACYFEISEALYDLDVPSQWLRRIRGVTLTVPGVSGPYTTLNARLTLMESFTRTRDVDGTLVADTAITESIVTSGQNDDSGLFRFDLGDPRYLPFERRGAISRWKLELTGAVGSAPFPTFDPRSIDDVILTIRYTARDGSVRAPALDTALDGRFELDHNGSAFVEGDGLPALGLSVRRDFPDAWYAMMNPASVGDATLSIPLTDAHFPHADNEMGVTVTALEIYPLADVVSPAVLQLSGADIRVATVAGTTGGTPTTGSAPLCWKVDTFDTAPGAVELEFDTSTTPEVDSDLRKLAPDDHKFNPEVLRDLILVIRYDVV